MPTHQIQRSWQRGNESISQAETIYAEAELCLDFEIPPHQTVRARLGLWRDELVALYLSVSHDVAVALKQGETPQAALNLLAGVPVIWTKASGFPPPLNGDVDHVVFRNPGDEPAIARLRVLRHAPALEVLPQVAAPEVAEQDEAA